MMDDAVDNGHGDVIIAEELAPVGEFLVGGQDDRPVFIQRVDELKQSKRSTVPPMKYFSPAASCLF